MSDQQQSPNPSDKSQQDLILELLLSNQDKADQILEMVEDLPELHQMIQTLPEKIEQRIQVLITPAEGKNMTFQGVEKLVSLAEADIEVQASHSQKLNSLLSLVEEVLISRKSQTLSSSLESSVN